jgi:TolB-like protein/Tfp pilus assembly protein PilF
MEEARLGMMDTRSIAVLPFINRSEKKDDEYFTDGMHDELLTRLSRISELKVISRTSMMHYRDTKKTIPEIARELSVATILEGGVQRSGNQVRINVQLIDAHTDEHLWAEIYDRELTAENLFAIQSEISTVIAESLHATLSPEEKSRVYDLPTSSLDAYNHYLRGRQLMASRSRESLQQALGEFELAVDIDPEFALAWVGVGDVHHLLFEIGVFDRSDHLEVHKQAVEKALALNDQLGEAYASLAFSYGDRREFEKQKAALLKAIELNPNYAQAYHWYANIQSGSDREEKRLQLLYKAAQLDPLSSVVQLNIASALQRLGREEESRQRLEQLLEMDPDYADAYNLLGNIAARSGQFARAVQWYRKAMQLDPGNGRHMVDAATTYIALGDFSAVAKIREQMGNHLAADSWQILEVDFNVLTAQSKWQDALSLLDELPAQAHALPIVSWGYRTTYMLSGDFERAHDYVLKDRPYMADRELWEQEFTDRERFDCESAGILVEAGDKALGQDLLRLFIRNFEAPPSGQQPDTSKSREVLACYLVEGSFDKALDILEQEIAQGRLIDNWWYLDKMPWWNQLENNPRYNELVLRIETLLAEQRELLTDLEKSGALEY